MKPVHYLCEIIKMSAGAYQYAEIKGTEAQQETILYEINECTRLLMHPEEDWDGHDIELVATFSQQYPVETLMPTDNFMVQEDLQLFFEEVTTNPKFYGAVQDWALTLGEQSGVTTTQGQAEIISKELRTTPEVIKVILDKELYL